MSDDLEQRPFNPELADNPEPRVALALVLDSSGSMSGDPIRQLNEGLKVLEEELKADSLASKRVEIAIITFGPVKIETDFTPAAHFFSPEITASGDTPMGAAIETALDLLDARKQEYIRNGIGYYQPWLFVITDGAPTDSYTAAASRIKELDPKKLSAFAVAVEGGDLNILRKIFVREPLKLKGLSFGELFRWVSASMKAVSGSRPGEGVELSPPTGPNGWATTG